MLNIKKIIYLYVFIGIFCNINAYAGSYEDFFLALEKDNARAVAGLLEHGFDPNSVSPKGVPALLAAIKAPAPQAAAILAQDPRTRIEVRTAQDESALMLAALKGDEKLCRLLIARDAQVNKVGWTPLHYAATGGYIEVVNLLLENYAYIDAESPNHSTPLMMAAMYGNASTVQALLEAGADPTLKNEQGLTALDFAQKANRADSLALIAAAIRGRSAGGW